MEPARFYILAACYLALRRDGKVLMLRRHNTGWQDGKYTLPSGHIENGETVEAATVRETKEEIGVDVDPADLTLEHIAFRKSVDREYVDFYMTASRWRGEPSNAEPDKSDDVRWFGADELPENTIDYVFEVLGRLGKPGAFFSEFGFGKG